jgi:hypothetical protein
MGAFTIAAADLSAFDFREGKSTTGSSITSVDVDYTIDCLTEYIVKAKRWVSLPSRKSTRTITPLGILCAGIVASFSTIKITQSTKTPNTKNTILFKFRICYFLCSFTIIILIFLVRTEESMKHFTKNGGMPLLQRPDSGLELTPNKKYRLTRQMYLFPEQEVSPQVNDYLRIGAVVTYLKSGELVEDQNVRMPWVYVRSEKQKKSGMGKGQEGWCFSHYLQMAENEEDRT